MLHMQAIKTYVDKRGGFEFAKRAKNHFGKYTWGNFNRCIFWLECFLMIFIENYSCELHFYVFARRTSYVMHNLYYMFTNKHK
jgi:hypothetical protein